MRVIIKLYKSLKIYFTKPDGLVHDKSLFQKKWERANGILSHVNLPKELQGK